MFKYYDHWHYRSSIKVNLFWNFFVWTLVRSIIGNILLIYRSNLVILVGGLFNILKQGVPLYHKEYAKRKLCCQLKKWYLYKHFMITFAIIFSLILKLCFTLSLCCFNFRVNTYIFFVNLWLSNKLSTKCLNPNLIYIVYCSYINWAKLILIFFSR